VDMWGSFVDIQGSLTRDMALWLIDRALHEWSGEGLQHLLGATKRERSESS